MFLTVVDGFPIGPWVANDSKSRWISPTNNDHDASSNTVPFVVETTFNLAGLDPTTAVITGKWAADNGGVVRFASLVQRDQAERECHRGLVAMSRRLRAR